MTMSEAGFALMDSTRDGGDFPKTHRPNLLVLPTNGRR